MRLLFEMDLKNYDPGGTVGRRDSARAIIIKENKIAMVFTLNRGFYKIPGGGIEQGESHKAAMIRETMEEAGLRVIPESVREYGYVHRAQKGKWEDIFVQDNFYYFCDAEDQPVEQKLDEYEKNEGYELRFVTPEEAVKQNKIAIEQISDLHEKIFLERENLLLELLVREGYFNQ